MKYQGRARARLAQYVFGSAYAFGRQDAVSSNDCFWQRLEKTRYIIPESVELNFYGEQLRPTQFDDHGNPLVGGAAARILTWKLRQKVRDGIINSEYEGIVGYYYETTYDDMPMDIPCEMRLLRADVCPVCGGRFTVYDLDWSDEIVEETIGKDGKKSFDTHWESRVARLDHSDTLAHRECANEYHRLKMIDEITEDVGLVFRHYGISEKNHFEWGKGERDIWYELISNEYCPTPERGCCSHRPWFLFHTPIGDIKIGWRKRVISITFMANFVPFDMAIFASEDVTKDVNADGTRTIHASDNKKMCMYLDKVYKTILSNKEK